MCLYFIKEYLNSVYIVKNLLLKIQEIYAKASAALELKDKMLFALII